MTQPPLVLIVDDNEQNAKLARDVLRADGLETLTATTAAEAIALAREHLPDVILMDMRLPDMTGADAARTLAAGTRTATIPVVALSALRLDDRDWLVAGGFAGYLEKPIDVAQFPHEVRCYCARAAPAPR